MDLHLSGSRALVVGASGGIGGAIAAALVDEGASVAGAGRSTDRLDGALYPVTVDVTDSASIVSGVGAAVDHLGGLDIVVVSAARNAFGTLWTSDRQHWRDQFEVKYVGIADLCREASSHMTDGGVLVLITGIAAEIPFSGNPAGGGLPKEPSSRAPIDLRDRSCLRTDRGPARRFVPRGGADTRVCTRGGQAACLPAAALGRQAQSSDRSSACR